MSNTYHVTIDAVIMAESFEEAISKYADSDFYIDSHSFNAPNGDSFDEQEQYILDCWLENKEPDWTEIKDPDGDDYK